MFFSPLFESEGSTRLLPKYSAGFPAPAGKTIPHRLPNLELHPHLFEQGLSIVVYWQNC
jgi:hypothetical protein